MNARASRRVLARTVAAKLLSEPTRREHWLKSLAAYMIERRMVEAADLIVNDIAHELFVQGGILLTDVTSARPLSDGLRRELTDLLLRQTGAQEVILSEHINADLLGGLIARTPDHELDASVRTTLRKLATIK